VREPVDESVKWFPAPGGDAAGGHKGRCVIRQHFEAHTAERRRALARLELHALPQGQRQESGGRQEVPAASSLSAGSGEDLTRHVKKCTAKDQR
jgi:hypothetical protein